MKKFTALVVSAGIMLCVVGKAAPPEAPATELRPRVEALAAQVVPLPNTGDEGARRSVLRIGLERVNACIEAGCDADAAALLAEMERALQGSAAAMAAPSANTAGVTSLRPPKVVQGNPYLDRLLAGAKAELATEKKSWPKSTAQHNAFDINAPGTGSRDIAEEMSAWLWLFVNPASPLKDDAEVLARFLRLAHAYADAMDALSSDAAKAKAGQGIYDDFAIAPAASALREFAQLYPGLLLPSQKAQWDRAMLAGGGIMFGKAKDRQGDYANIDLALAYQMLNFGLYLNNQEYLAKGQFLAEIQAKNLYPDGAIAYIGRQNESHGYHDTDTYFLGQYYLATENAKVLEILRATEWFGPVTSGRLAEFWTVPSWKDTWNSSSIPAGGEVVASVTGNPYLRGLRLAELARTNDVKRWYSNRSGVFWYRDDVKPLPLPDNYTVVDRNIAGPRAWYGRFNYAASLRPIPESESGLATLMGAQVTGTDGQIGQVLMGVYPRVRQAANSFNKDGSFNRGAFAWRTAGLKSSAVIGRSFSAISGSYRLQQYRSSTAGKAVDWNGRQLWFGHPGGIVGLIELSAAKEGASAFALEGVLRLGTGGTVNGKPTKIAQTGPNDWDYGDIHITLVGHNYADVTAVEVPFRRPQFPNTELRLLAEKGPSAPAARPYPAATRHWFLVEIHPSWVKEPVTATRIEQPGGAASFSVKIGEKSFVLLDNPGSAPAQIAINLPAAPRATLHRPDAAPGPLDPSGVTLAPGELAVAVSSPDAADHLPGWKNFQEMVSTPASPQPK